MQTKPTCFYDFHVLRPERATSAYLFAHQVVISANILFRNLTHTINNTYHKRRITRTPKIRNVDQIREECILHVHDVHRKIDR